MAHYSTQIYWERRYSTHRGATFDWYLPYSDLLREELNSSIRRGSRILVLGCGTSLLTEGLYDDGYTNLVAVDFSPSAVEVMAERSGVSHSFAEVSGLENSSTVVGGGNDASINGASVKTALPKEPLPESDIKPRPGLVYMVANATDLPSIFTPGSFDVVLDKAMLDACFCGDSDVQQRKFAARVVSNVYTVLKPKTGKFIHISHTNKTQGIRSVLFDDEVTPWSDVNVTKLVTNATGAVDPSASTTGGGDGGNASSAGGGSEFLTRSHFMYIMSR